MDEAGGQGVAVHLLLERAMSDTPRPAHTADTKLAAAALVLGLLAFVRAIFPLPAEALLGMAAILLGVLSLLRATNRSPMHAAKPLAVIAICAGVVALVLVPLGQAMGPRGGAGTIDHRAIRQAVFDGLDEYRAQSEQSPEMAKAREQAARVRCAANLRSIGQALMIYSNEFMEEVPAQLTMLDTELGYLRPAQLRSPLNEKQDRACDYFFVQESRRRNRNKNWLMAWGDPAYTDGAGASVLYTDGHTEFLEQPKFDEVMERFLREFQEKNKREPKIIKPQ